MRSFCTSCAMVLLALGLPASATAHAEGFDHRALAKAAIIGHVRPGYQKLHDATSALERSVDALCRSPSADTLKASRAAFRGAVTARAAIEHIRFGPITRANRHERLSFWPDPKGIGRRQVRRALKRRKPGYDDPTALASMSVALQGLTALEFVLFSKPVSGSVDGVLTDPFRCGVARAISWNLKNIADALVREWSEGAAFVKAMLAPGQGNTVYLKDSEVTLELTQSYMSGLIFARDQKIERPLGGEFGPSAKSVEYRLSNSGQNALRGNVEGLREFYVDGGLRDALASVSRERLKRGDDSFEAARAMLAAISLPLERAVVDDENIERMINLSLALSGARSAVGKGISLAAGLSLGFNAGDGD